MQPVVQHLAHGHKALGSIPITLYTLTEYRLHIWMCVFMCAHALIFKSTFCVFGHLPFYLPTHQQLHCSKGSSDSVCCLMGHRTASAPFPSYLVLTFSNTNQSCGDRGKHKGRWSKTGYQASRPRQISTTPHRLAVHAGPRMLL